MKLDQGFVKRVNFGFLAPLVQLFAFYDVGEVLYNWTGVRVAEIKRNN